MMVSNIWHSIQHLRLRSRVVNSSAMRESGELGTSIFKTQFLPTLTTRNFRVRASTGAPREFSSYNAIMESTVPILETLTPAQLAAVTHVDGPMLILAGPGSGKTRVVTHRIAYLLEQGIPARQILALTFTNKAAEEMRSRLNLLVPDQPVWMGTFHRFCSRLLRIHAPLIGLSENFSIFDIGDARTLLLEAIDEAGVELTHATPDGVAHEISYAKNELIGPQDYVARPGKSLGVLVQKVYPLYQKRLLRANAVDFDDLLLHVATLLRENPELRRTLDERYRYILVDEYQDTNFAQYTIVRALSQDFPNLAVTGDPDQSIYGWRGANLNNILEFEHDYPQVRVVRLEQNYRSTKRILRVADQLIANNVRRKHKELFTENPMGSRSDWSFIPPVTTKLGTFLRSLPIRSAKVSAIRETLRFSTA